MREYTSERLPACDKLDDGAAPARSLAHAQKQTKLRLRSVYQYHAGLEMLEKKDLYKATCADALVCQPVTLLSPKGEPSLSVGKLF